MRDDPAVSQASSGAEQPPRPGAGHRRRGHDRDARRARRTRARRVRARRAASSGGRIPPRGRERAVAPERVLEPVRRAGPRAPRRCRRGVGRRRRADHRHRHDGRGRGPVWTDVRRRRADRGHGREPARQRPRRRRSGQPARRDHPGPIPGRGWARRGRGVRRRGPRLDDGPQDRQHRPGRVRLAYGRPGRADRRGPRVAARHAAPPDTPAGQPARPPCHHRHDLARRRRRIAPPRDRDQRRRRARRPRRRPSAARRPGHPSRGRGARARGHHLPPGPFVDAVRDLRLRGRRAGSARQRRDVRPLPVGAGGAHGPAGLPRRRPRPRRASRPRSRPTTPVSSFLTTSARPSR